MPTRGNALQTKTTRQRDEQPTDNHHPQPLITTITTQYHMSKRLKVFGEPGVAAVLKELKQLHDRMVMYPTNVEEITKCQIKAALQYLMFLKQKRYGKINVRG